MKVAGACDGLSLILLKHCLAIGQAHWPLICVAIWLGALAATAATSLPLPNLGFAQDLGVMLDAGWRFCQGQKAHADYHTPLGPVLGVVFGIPMIVGGATYDSLRMLPWSITAICTLWTFAIGLRSLPSVPLVFVSMAVGSVGGGLYHFGFAPESLSFATVYNRYGFAVLTIISLAALLPSSHPSHNATLRTATVLVGTLLLLFLKINFFLAALPFVLIWLFGRPHANDGLGLVIAVTIGAAVCFALLWSIGFRVDRMLVDVRTAAVARSQSLAGRGLAFSQIFSNIDILCLIGIQSCLTPRKCIDQFVLWAPAVVGFGVILGQSHGDGSGIPLALAGLAASASRVACLNMQSSRAADDKEVTASGGDRSVATALRRQVSAAVTISAALLFVIPHAQSYYHLRRVSSGISGRQFQGVPLRNLFVSDYVNSWGRFYPDLTNEAFALVKRNCAARDTLHYLGYTNVFNFACGLPSARGSLLFWDATASCPRNQLPATEVFQDAKFLLVPTERIDPVTRELTAGYDEFLTSRYELREKTEHFSLYARRDGEASH
jgi:hypothetical protein